MLEKTSQALTIEERRKRLNEDARAIRGFSLLCAKLQLTKRSIRYLKDALLDHVPCFWDSHKGISLSLAYNDIRALGRRVQRLSKDLESLNTAHPGTNELIGEIFPQLHELALSLDPSLFGSESLKPSMRLETYLALNRRSENGNIRIFAMRELFKWIKIVLDSPIVSEGFTPKTWPKRGEWPSDIALQRPPCEAIGLIITALLGLDREISPSSVSRALKL